MSISLSMRYLGEERVKERERIHTSVNEGVWG